MVIVVLCMIMNPVQSAYVDLDEWQAEQEIINGGGSGGGFYADDYDPYADLTALDNPLNEFFKSSATAAFWMVAACAIGVLYASYSEMWYDVFVETIRKTKYPNL